MKNNKKYNIDFLLNLSTPDLKKLKKEIGIEIETAILNMRHSEDILLLRKALDDIDEILESSGENNG